MIIKFLMFLFNNVIGTSNISPEKKKEFLERFETLLGEVAEKAAEGAVKGAQK